MEPSAFALAELKKKLSQIERSLVDAKRKTIDAREAVIDAAVSIAGCAPDKDEGNPGYNMDFSPKTGVKIVVSPSKADGCRKFYALWRAALKLESDLCAERCRTVELMATDMLRKFRLFCVEAEGKQPTDREIAARFADWLMLQLPHVCPVR